MKYNGFETQWIPSIVNIGESIASEGKGQYMWVEGRVLDTHGAPLSDVVVETWETDEYVAVYNPILTEC